MSYSREEVAGSSAASAAPVVRVVGLLLLTMRKTLICKCSLRYHTKIFKKIQISGGQNFWKCGYIGGAANACVYNAVELKSANLVDLVDMKLRFKQP